MTGAPVELAGALEAPTVGSSGGVTIPWEVLSEVLSPAESRALNKRAFTDTGDLAGAVSFKGQSLQRLFGVGILDALGVRLDSVPAGRSEWPLAHGRRCSGPQVAEGTAAGGCGGGDVLTPKRSSRRRLTGKYEYTHEQAAQVPELESALRRDLGDAVKAKMSEQILNGR